MQTFSISYEIYNEFQRNIVNLFRDKEAELSNGMRSDEPRICVVTQWALSRVTSLTT